MERQLPGLDIGKEEGSTMSKMKSNNSWLLDFWEKAHYFYCAPLFQCGPGGSLLQLRALLLDKIMQIACKECPELSF